MIIIMNGAPTNENDWKLRYTDWTNIKAEETADYTNAITELRFII